MARLKFLDSYVFRLALGYTAMVVSVISLVFIFSYAAADHLVGPAVLACDARGHQRRIRRPRPAL